MNKAKRLRAVIIVAVVVAAAAGLYRHFRPASGGTATNLGTTIVGSTSLAETISAAGNIQSHRTADLAFGESGTVTKVNVQLGDHVKSGQVLGQLDTSNLDLALRTAEVDLKNAQDALAEAKAPYTSEDIDDARAALVSAQAAYDKVVAGASQAELAAAQASVDSAQAAYDAAVKSASTSDSSLIEAAATLDKDRITVQQAQSAYDLVSWRGNAASSGEAATLQSATIDYNSAKAAYDALAATTTTSESSSIASAFATLESAKASLDTLQDQVTNADLTSAQSTLTQAKNTLAKELAGPTKAALDEAENSVETAQIALDQARINLQEAQVLAPFDGIVTAVDVKQDETVSGTAFSIADLDHLEITVNMDEVDVDEVKVGQPVSITLDAVPDLTLGGSVTEIAPAGTTSSGVVSYPVTVALSQTQDSALDGVKTGMTAELNIIVAEHMNVLAVPNKAVKTMGNQKSITVLYKGQQIAVPVQTGLTNDTMTEITSGLKAGDVVIVSAGTTKSTTTSGAAGGGMGAIGMPGMGGPPGP
jgi:HlyD family secretion protein